MADLQLVAHEILAEIIACEDAGDYSGLCDLDGGAPGENSPYQSQRLANAMAAARALMKLSDSK